MSLRRTTGLAVQVAVLLSAGTGLWRCVAGDARRADPCTESLCESGSRACCATELPGTWNPTAGSCSCSTSADADACSDADECADAVLEEGGDVPGEVDDEADADADGDAAACEYPEGPYSFTYQGIAPPMNWPTAVPGPDETLPADLTQIRCDPGVRSIFILVMDPECAACGGRAAAIAGQRETWEANGTKWIIVVRAAEGHFATAEEVRSHVESAGFTFGWWTHDGDNAVAPFAILDSGIFSNVPWTGVIRSTTMELVCDEPDDAFLDLDAISGALAADPEADLSAYCTRH